MLAGESLIAIANPRHRLPPRNRKGRFMKRGHHKSHNPSHRKHGGRRRSGHRKSHNPAVGVPVMSLNRGRRAHRNPRFRLPGMGGQTGALVAGALTGAVGALALDLALSYGQQYLPDMMTTPGWGRNATRIAGAFAVGYAARFVVSRPTAHAVLAGALTIVAYDIVKQLANQYVLPAGQHLGGEDGSYPYGGYYPFLTGVGRSGGSGYSGEQGGAAGLRGYLTGRGRVRTNPLVSPRQTVSAFIEPESGPMGDLGADIEI